MYKATTKNNIITESSAILPDGFASISIFNKGDDTVFVNDNIEIEPGASFGFENPPYAVIDENTDIRFDTVVNPKVLIIKTYFKQVKR